MLSSICVYIFNLIVYEFRAIKAFNSLLTAKFPFMLIIEHNRSSLRQLMVKQWCCVHNASTVPWTSAGQFGRPRGVRGRPWYDLWRPRCVISHPMDVRGLPPGRPPSGRPRDTQFGIDWSLLPSGCPQGVRTAEVQPITARTHYGQEVGLPTVRPKPEVDVP